MAHEPSLRAKAEAKLAMGKSPQEVSDEMGLPYITINGWANKLKAVSAEDTIAELVQADEKTLLQVKTIVEEKAPPKVAAEIVKVVDGVLGLQSLEPKFVTVVTKLLTKAEKMADDKDLSVGDWVSISKAIGLLYSNIYNKGGTNINVLNQAQASNEKLTMFKGANRG